MASKDQLKSARKKFMVMKVKTSIIGLQSTKDEDVEAELEKLRVSLAKTFGDDQALEIIEGALEAADEQMSRIIGDATAAEMAKS